MDNEQTPEQNPPEGYEPQVEVGPTDPAIYEAPSDLIADAEDEDEDEALADNDGSAADDSDEE
jgi:hypothetical protein